MWMVDGIRVLIAELVDNLGYSVVILGIQCISDEGFELECSALALVVELIIERFSDIGVHDGVWASVGRLHVV
jgi:hypothetical protein